MYIFRLDLYVGVCIKVQSDYDVSGLAVVSK